MSDTYARIQRRRRLTIGAIAISLVLVISAYAADRYSRERRAWLSSASISSLASAAKRYPDDHEIQFQYAFRLSATGRNEEALQIMRSLTQSQPSNYSYWFGLGRVSAGAGRPAEAEQAYLKAEQLRPNNPDVVFVLGELYSAAGLDSAAIEQFRRGQELGHAPDGTRAYWARSLYRTGRFQESWKILSESLSNFPMQDDPYLMLADLAPRVSRVKEAMKMLQRRLDMTKMYPTAVARAPMARLLALKGDGDAVAQAEEMVRIALTDGRAVADCRAAMAAVNLRRGKFREALVQARLGLKKEAHEGCLAAASEAAGRLGLTDLSREYARARKLRGPLDARLVDGSASQEELLRAAREHAAAQLPGKAADLSLAASDLMNARELRNAAIASLVSQRAGASPYLAQTHWAD